MSDEKKFEVFVNRSLKHYRNHIRLMGRDGSGRKLTEDEIMGSVKIHIASRNKISDFEILAKELNFDIESAALEAINEVDSY